MSTYHGIDLNPAYDATVVEAGFDPADTHTDTDTGTGGRYVGPYLPDQDSTLLLPRVPDTEGVGAA